MLHDNSTTEGVSTGWKVCYADYEGTLTDEYAPHAYYDASQSCYCYDYCPDWNVYPAYRQSAYAYQYFSPAVFAIGIVGNLMILAMFQTKELKNMPSRPFFQALAVTDNIVLIVNVLVFSLREGFSIEMLISAAACKLRYFTSYVASSSSGFLVAALTIDRFVSVTWPMKVQIITYKHRVMVISLMYVIFGVFYSHFLVYWEYDYGREEGDKNVCNINLTEYHYGTFIRKYFFWLQLTVNFLVPFLVIVVCNIGMIKSLRKSEGTEIASTKSETQASKRLTLLCILIGTAFLITMAPQNISSLRIGLLTNPRTYSYELLIGSVMRNLSYTNHAMNFFLYCVVGRKFRSALISLLRCRNT